MHMHMSPWNVGSYLALHAAITKWEETERDQKFRWSGGYRSVAL